MSDNEQLNYGNLRWYEFRQNNSGGSFVMDDEVSIHVFIQAESADAANQKAEKVGIYFDGCEDGSDCSCCGDRWYRADDPLDSFKTYPWRGEPKEYDNISDYAQALAADSGWAKRGDPANIVYFADGSVKRFYKWGR
jgi:hypothetical protein